MPDPIVNRTQAWDLMTRGVHEVAKVVSKTYGPRGGKVMVEKGGSVLVTTDGAALTRESQLGGSLSLGAALVRSAAIRTEEEVGDGTSTTVLLTSAILRALGKLACDSTWDPVEVVREIREAHLIAESEIRALSIDADPKSLNRVALMASHEDPLVAEKVVEAVLAVGEGGSVVISPYEGTTIVSEQKEGLYLEHGWASSEMGPSDGSLDREMEGPLVAVFRNTLRKAAEITSAMEQASQWPGRGLVVFAPSIHREVLTTLLLNDKKGILSSVAVTYSGNPRELTDWLEDLAAVTNSTIADAKAGLDPEKFEAPWLGYARRIIVSKKKTLVISYMDEEILANIDRRVSQLKAHADSSAHPYDRDRLTQRASALDGGLCTLRVGGFTKQEAQDRRSRVEDTLLSVQTCLRGGVVPGGGQAYLIAASSLPKSPGAQVLKHALEAPFMVLAQRSGLEPRVALSKFELDREIIDPTEVSVVALRNAVSVACQIALSGGIVPPRPRRKR